MVGLNAGVGVALIGATVLIAASSRAPAQPSPPLTIEARIPLGDVKGRIDHLDVDAGRGVLAVAELGQGAVGLVDLKRGVELPRIDGLKEPQGLALVGRDVVVATGVGWVRRFSTETRERLAEVRLGDDADDVRLRPGSGEILVGYGSGALALLDPKAEHVLAAIPLAAHPEGFQVGPDGDRVYVNLPARHRIDVVSLKARRVVASIGTGLAFANFPMAIDAKAGRLVVAFRTPAEVHTYALSDNHLLGRTPTCGDADDVFVDQEPGSIYVTCGSGEVDTLRSVPEGYRSTGRTMSASGARTGLWSPESGRLYVAAPARDGRSAAILTLRPS